MSKIYILLFCGLLVGIIAFAALTYDLTASKKQDDSKTDFFAIYGHDRQCSEEEVNFYVSIPPFITLPDKLNMLADRISRFKFNGLPITVMKIESRGNKKIAIIDLQEIQSEDGLAWKKNYFQGSAGGKSTEITLKKSFLQREYNGQWIDGVEFLYNGKPVLPGQWDHIDLSGTTNRIRQ